MSGGRSGCDPFEGYHCPFVALQQHHNGEKSTLDPDTCWSCGGVMADTLASYSPSRGPTSAPLSLSLVCTCILHGPTAMRSTERLGRQVGSGDTWRHIRKHRKHLLGGGKKCPFSATRGLRAAGSSSLGRCTTAVGHGHHMGHTAGCSCDVCLPVCLRACESEVIYISGSACCSNPKIKKCSTCTSPDVLHLSRWASVATQHDVQPQSARIQRVVVFLLWCSWT